MSKRKGTKISFVTGCPYRITVNEWSLPFDANAIEEEFKKMLTFSLGEMTRDTYAYLPLRYNDNGFGEPAEEDPLTIYFDIPFAASDLAEPVFKISFTEIVERFIDNDGDLEIPLEKRDKLSKALRDLADEIDCTRSEQEQRELADEIDSRAE